jgi:hypothetical protein
MHRLEEMIGQKKGRNPVTGIVIDQDGAQKRLFRLQIVGRRAVGIAGAVGIDGADEGGG